jgi:signal transduction histidine kinase/ActR/RegA family two-component response regulator
MTRDQSLKTPKERFEAILNSIPAALIVYRCQVNGTITIEAANAQVPAICHSSLSDLTERDFSTILPARIHPQDFELVQLRLQELFSTDKIVNFTYRSLDESLGQYFWLTCTARSQLQSDGSRLAYAIYTDATVQKEEEARFEQLMRQIWLDDEANILIFHLNLTQNTYNILKPLPAEILDLRQAHTAEDFIQQCINTMTDEADRQAARQFISRAKLIEAFKEGREMPPHRFRFQLPDGSQRWAEAVFKTELNPSSGDYETLGHTRDITAGVEEENIIRYLSLEHFDFIALIHRRDGSVHFSKFKEAIRATIPRFSNNYDEDVAQAIKMTVPLEDQAEAWEGSKLSTIVQALELKPVYLFSCTLSGPHDLTLRKEFRFAYIDADRQNILLTRTDITQIFEQQQKQMQLLQEALKMAEKANQSKSEFLSRVSHDIRTPMNIISGMTDFAFQDLDDKEKLRQDLEKIKTANTFLLSLINDILDLAKIDSGSMELHPEPYDYHEFMANIRNLFEPLCQQKKQQLILHEDPQSAMVSVDKVRLNQIVLNLISNAIKYTPSGGQIEFWAGARVYLPGKTAAHFIIRDSGVGMSKAFQEKMFDPFSQELLPQQIRVNAYGTGLGLSIVKKLVGLMGGRIEVDSKVGSGTTITVLLDLPEAKPEDFQETGYLDQLNEESLRAQLSGRKVLLAEDHPMNAEISTRLLTSAGLEVELAVNGWEAVQRFNQAPEGTFTAILMDIQMPVMNGYEASLAIRALNRPDAAAVPILALTANAFAEDVERAKAAGMNGHLSKPINKKQLFMTLAKLVPPK